MEFRLAEQQLSAILAIAADAIISLNENMRIMVFNEGAASIFGYAKDEIIGQSLDVLIPEALSRESSRACRRVRRLSGGRTPDGRATGDLRTPQEWRRVSRRGLDRQAGDRWAPRVSWWSCATSPKEEQAEAALARANSELERRVAERTRELEAEISRREAAHAALVQAQRMEAFGQLTGGVAHDFNNLLTIVTGNLELLADTEQPEPSRTLLKRAADAADMGAALTKRLLTFARRRRLSPQVVDINDLVLGLMEILKRSIGEHITLTTILAGNVWTPKVDPSEIENAILNLAINARDAMPEGGELIVETRNVAGADLPFDGGDREFVLLSVSDTGEGMTPEVLERAFEPFFSTKEPGRGTGLGLSTVYGFAEQSGGHATIESEVGFGTTVSLYLPRADVGAEATARTSRRLCRCRRTMRSSSSSRTTPKSAN